MKNILITGVSSGIGKEVYNIFKNKNYCCYGLDICDSDFDNFFKCDVASAESIEKIFNFFVNQHIKFDVIVPCAVYQNKTNFVNLKIKDFNKTISTNICGTLNILKLASDMHLIEKNAKIIVPTSIHHLKPRRNHLAYDISKAAITMMIKELAIDFADYSYSINGVSFGAVRTPLNNDWLKNEEEVKKVIDKVPMKVILEPKYIAEFIYNMTTEVFKYCTGSIYEIDGGRHLI